MPESGAANAKSQSRQRLNIEIEQAGRSTAIGRGGDHGGSLKFCHRFGPAFVSCSPPPWGRVGEEGLRQPVLYSEAAFFMVARVVKNLRRGSSALPQRSGRRFVGR